MARNSERKTITRQWRSRMILAEKIMHLRKKNGWSQEELAGKLNVSRQSVSKWESAMSVPDLDKILQLSEIFEVSTDYLLKDDKTEEDYIPGNPESGEGTRRLRKVTMEEAQNFLKIRRDASVKMALGVAACVFSPVPLLLLGGMAAGGMLSMTEEKAGGLGLFCLLVIVACAVVDFILFGMKLGKYEYLEKENFELAYGVEGMVREKYEAQEQQFAIRIATGVVLCIAGVVPLIFAATFVQKPAAMVGGVIFLLLMAAAAVYLFVNVGMIKGAYEQVLQVGDYTQEGKEDTRVIGRIASVYWCVVTAAYVGYSLWSKQWAVSWVIWPVAGILFGAIASFIKMRRR